MNNKQVASSSSAVLAAAGLVAGHGEADKRLLAAFEETRVAGVDAMGAALAHELNQPLAALMLYLQSLQRACARDASVAPLLIELVGKGLREAERAGEIVRRMRRFSARGEPERLLSDMNALANDSIELGMLGAPKKTQLKRQLDTALPVVACDAVQIRQVMVNLIKNAVEATSRRPKPQITVATEIRDGFAQLSVADNGPGVDPRIQDRLFRAFQTSKPQGMGLGLAISRMIAQNHGGDLVLVPGEIGGGACFGLRLPLK
jgi:two-component system, LuxR family, sensor kinase FixL